MKRISTAVLMLISCTAFAQSENIPAAVETTMDWEKRWFGTYFGEQCVDKVSRNTLSLRVAKNKQDRKIGENCDSGSPIVVPSQTFEAFLPQAGIFITGQVAPYPNAVISDGEGRPDCSLTEDDLKRTATGLQQATFDVRPPKALARRPVIVSEALDLFVVRTLSAYVRQTHRDMPSSLLVGTSLRGDPFVVASLDDGATFLLIEIPGERQLSNSNFCGLVYNGGRFVGRAPLGAAIPDDATTIKRVLNTTGRRLSLKRP